ncbi:mechanosensitive ion channel family protein [Neisseria sp.]|uniref:mechanosensitive ion channel family protein n=1 Tax=Neisseria sp. TaxID=192066 RepID=UPI0028982764|nr:mechanosensitive ion channel family protein [Neisseria sp.]
MTDLFNYLVSLLENSPIRLQWIYSVLLVLAVLIIRQILLQLNFRRHPEMEIEDKRRAVVVSRNLAFIACILGLFAVWASQIQTFALSMVAVAAATVLATKELIMCLSGSLLRAVTKQYSVGDYIEIGHMRGRVVDINLLNTLMMQVGPNDLIGQLSGKTISFPNSLLLSQTVQRDNILGSFVVHTFEIPVPIHLDSDAIVPPLDAVLQKKCAPYIQAIEKYHEVVQVQKLFIMPAARPRISRVPHDDKLYLLVVRFASPVAKRLEIQQLVLDEFLRIQYRLLKSDPIIP